MAASGLKKLTLVASTVADDVGFVALADLSSLLAGDSAAHRVIGGHMVTALAARWQLGEELYRQTADTDLGVPPAAIRDGHLIQRLSDLGYERTAGNRFERSLDEDQAGPGGRRAPERRAVIDVLVPAYTTRARQNHRVGEIVTTEVPGLAAAMGRADAQGAGHGSARQAHRCLRPLALPGDCVRSGRQAGAFRPRR